MSHLKIMTTDFSVSIKLDRLKVSLSRYSKFNGSLLDEKDFQDLLELILKGELTGAITENSWLDNFEDRFRFFTVHIRR